MQNTTKQYLAIGLNNSLENKRVAGSLEITKYEVQFFYNGTKVSLPTQGIQVKIGGVGNSLIFFSHPNVSDWSIYTSDKSILDDPNIITNSAFSNLQRERKKGLYVTLAWVLGFTIFLTLIFYGLYYLRSSFSYALASRVPIEWEEKLGDSALKAMLLGKKVYRDEKILSLLLPVTQPLVEAAKDSGYKFQFYIVEDPMVNAFALPGGNVVIHSALILEAETPEEIAGVLAHEISHVTERHGTRQLINTIGIFVLVQTLFGDFTGLLAVLTQNSGLLLRAKFSRDFEREADAKGFYYLVSSKIDPSGMIQFFQKVQEIEKKLPVNSENLTFLSTHPGTEERIVKLKEKIQLVKDKEFISISMNLKQLKKLLKEKN